MTTSTWYIRVLVAGAAVGAVLAADSTGILHPFTARTIDDLAQLGASAFATVACLLTARKVGGAQRLWRVLIGAGMGAWMVGQALWTGYRLFTSRGFPSPSIADLGYLAFPVFAFAALVVIGTVGAEKPGEDENPRSIVPFWLIFTLDALIVLGSLLIVVWLTSLGQLVRAAAGPTLGFVVAVAYPVTDLLLVVLLVLLLSTRPITRPLRPQLALLALGLVAFAVSDTIFAHLAAVGAGDVPPLDDAGFVIGPILIGFAGLRIGQDVPVAFTDQGRAANMARMLLPYAPLALAAYFMVDLELTQPEQQAIEVVLLIPVVVLVVIRQVITIFDNQALLSQLSAAQRQLFFLAYHDPLTGLANRTLFRSRLDDRVERQSGRQVALFFVDLDDFKSVNDALGHAAGDRALQAVAQRLRACVRSTDLIARLGGDEFGVLVDDDLSDRDVIDPAVVGQRILTALHQPFDVDGRRVAMSASMGAALLRRTDPRCSSEELLHRADAAMYAGKRRGKGLLRFYDPRQRPQSMPDTEE